MFTVTLGVSGKAGVWFLLLCDSKVVLLKEFLSRSNLVILVQIMLCYGSCSVYWRDSRMPSFYLRNARSIPDTPECLQTLPDDLWRQNSPAPLSTTIPKWVWLWNVKRALVTRLQTFETCARMQINSVTKHIVYFECFPPPPPNSKIFSMKAAMCGFSFRCKLLISSKSALRIGLP